MIITIKKNNHFDSYRKCILIITTIFTILWFFNNADVYGYPITCNYLLIENDIQSKQQLTNKDEILDLYKRFINARTIKNKGKTALFIDSCNAILSDINKLPEYPYFIQYIYNSKGLAHKNLGNLYYSRICLELASFYDKKTPNQPLRISILTNMALIEIGKNNYKKAIELLNNILKTESNLEHDNINIINNNIAYCATELNDTITANRYFRKLLDIKTKKEPNNQFNIEILYRNYGKYLLNQKNYDGSKKYLNNALKECLSLYGPNHYQTAKCYHYLGYLHTSQNDLDSALISFYNAIKSMENDIIYSSEGRLLWINTSYETVFFELLNDRGKLFSRIAQNLHDTEKIFALNKAVDDYKQAIERITYLAHGISDESSRFILAKKGREVFNNGIVSAIELYDLTGNQEYFEMALNWSIQAKSLSLKWKSEKDKSYVSVGISENIVMDLARERSKINEFINNYQNSNKSTIYDSLNFYIKDYEEKEKQIQKKFPYIHNIIDTNWKINNLEKIFKRETYLGYLDLDTTMIVFCLNRNNKFYSYLSVDSGKNKILNNYKRILAKYNHGSYTAKDIIEFSSYSHQIYKWLISPFKESCINRKLTIHADGILLGLPFETLIFNLPSEYEKYSFKTLDYLFNNYQIRYITGPLPEKENVQRIKSRNTQVLFLTDNQQNNLPGIKDEISSVSKQFPNFKMDYFDKDQSKLSDNLNNANLIHIASHNMVNYMKPLKSSFTIKGNPDIANITFLDILHSRKKYHFAYINTCESGTGPVNIGEGFLSMGLAFMISGTKSTIQHLWKAPDRAASTISHNFYKYLNKTESCNALRNAKRKYLENTRPGLDHPHYWSGVLYYGQNWRINKIKWPVYIAISLGLFIFLYFVFRKRNFCSNFLTSFS